MDKIKLSKKNNIQNEIKTYETLLKKNNDTIERLSKSNENIDFNKKQIEKIKIQQKVIEEKIIELKNEYEKIISGSLDLEIKVNMENQIKNNKHKQELLCIKKEKEKQIKKQEEKENLDIEYKSRRGSGVNDYQISKETDKFFKNCSTIPDYMIQNLKDMPNNKGYVWRGIWCFGKKPQESENITMFEKCKGGLLKINEITNSNIYLYEKQGSNKKVLVSKTERKFL